MKHTKHATKPPDAVKVPARSRTLRWAIAGTTALLSAVVTIGLFENVFLSQVPAAMLGEWEVVKFESLDSLEGMRLDFHRNGSVTVRIGGREEDTNAYVDAEMLRFTITLPRGPQLTIAGPVIELTADEMVMEDEAGKTIKMRRPTGDGRGSR